MGIANAWHSIPWMVRTSSLALIAFILLIVILKIVRELVKAKKTFETKTPMPSETENQVSVEYIYNYVDSLIRAGKTSAENSSVAKQAGRDSEASAFAFAALAYLQSANLLAPRRVKTVLPNIDEMIAILNTYPSKSIGSSTLRLDQ